MFNCSNEVKWIRVEDIDGGVFDADEMVAYTVYAIASTIHQLGGNPRTFIEDMLDTIEGNTSDTEGE